MQKITSTSLLTSGFQIIFTIALGTFLLINAAIIGFKLSEGYDNYKFIQAQNIVSVGRMHTYDSRDFTDSTYGIPRRCVAIEEYNKITVRDESVGVPGFINTPSPSPFCKKLLNPDDVSNWKLNSPHGDGMHAFERILWTIAVAIVILAGGYLLAFIPATLMALTIPGLITWARLLTITFTIPVFIFCMVFVSSVWSSTPDYWTTMNGESIKTQKVFISANGNMYKAPETLYDWTDTTTATLLMEKRR